MKAVLYGFVGLPWAEHQKNGNHYLSKGLFLFYSGLGTTPTFDSGWAGGDTRSVNNFKIVPSMGDVQDLKQTSKKQLFRGKKSYSANQTRSGSTLFPKVRGGRLEVSTICLPR